MNLRVALQRALPLLLSPLLVLASSPSGYGNPDRVETKPTSGSGPHRDLRLGKASDSQSELFRQIGRQLEAMDPQQRKQLLEAFRSLVDSKPGDGKPRIEGATSDHSRGHRGREAPGEQGKARSDANEWDSDDWDGADDTSADPVEPPTTERAVGSRAVGSRAGTGAKGERPGTSTVSKSGSTQEPQEPRLDRPGKERTEPERARHRERQHEAGGAEGLDPSTLKPDDLEAILGGLSRENRESFKGLVEGLKNSGLSDSGFKDRDSSGGARKNPNEEFLEKLSKQLQSKSSQPGGEAGPMDGIAELLKDEKTRQFFEDLGGGLRKLSDMDQRAGGDGDLMPWLRDPNFPKNALDRLGQRSALDGALSDFAGSPKLKSWISNFQDWRRETDQRLPTQARPDPQRSSAESSATDPASGSTSESSTSAAQRRLAELTSSQSWSWLRAPDLRISGFASMPRFQAPSLSLSSFSLQGGSIGEGGRALATSLAIVLPALIALIWLFHRLGWVHGLRTELSRRAVARRLGAWPTPLQAMRSAEDLRRNFLHLHSIAEGILRPGQCSDHVELARDLARAAPTLAEASEQLCRDFAPTYYRAPQPELSREQLSAHGHTLEAISKALLKGPHA